MCLYRKNQSMKTDILVFLNFDNFAGIKSDPTIESWIIITFFRENTIMKTFCLISRITVTHISNMSKLLSICKFK